LADARDSKSRSVMSVGSIPTAGIFLITRRADLLCDCGLQ